jgi:hypothetical protein
MVKEVGNVGNERSKCKRMDGLVVSLMEVKSGYFERDRKTVMEILMNTQACGLRWAKRNSTQPTRKERKAAAEGKKEKQAMNPGPSMG